MTVYRKNDYLNRRLKNLLRCINYPPLVCNCNTIELTSLPFMKKMFQKDMLILVVVVIVVTVMILYTEILKVG